MVPVDLLAHQVKLVVLVVLDPQENVGVLDLQDPVEDLERVGHQEELAQQDLEAREAQLAHLVKEEV